MKKIYLLLLTFFTLLISGCEITFTYTDDNTTSDNSGNDSGNINQGGNTQDPPSSGNDNNTTPPSEEEEEEEEETPPITEEETPLVPELEIDSNSLFYPNTLTVNDSKVTSYTYIDDNLKNNYKIYSAYYSEAYDTIYIAYDYTNNPVQKLKAKDLYEIEKHAINYFISDTKRSEDANYLKAVRIYPDRLASSCRKGASDEVANNINGCADYGGKEAIIDLNATASLEDFYNPKKVYTTPTTYMLYEPMRDTFAHEYGHISTFYHMVYKNDENYEDYLKIRLSSYYNEVYPSGLPETYSSAYDYTIQPEEILADDFVELFYDTSNKKENDTYFEYDLEYSDLRNSLDYFSEIQMLKENTTIYNHLKNYYSRFINYKFKTTYEKPIVISSSSSIISYYESYSDVGNISTLKPINSLIDVNLIAVGEVNISNVKYYRVILSNTFNCPLKNGSRSCDKKDVGEKMGYVKASNFTINNSIKLYKLDKNGTETISKTSIIPIENNSSNNLYILPYYDFSYVLNTANNTNYATMYDYLSSSLSSTQTYRVNIHSFGTLIN